MPLMDTLYYWCSSVSIQGPFSSKFYSISNSVIESIYLKMAKIAQIVVTRHANNVFGPIPYKNFWGQLEEEGDD